MRRVREIFRSIMKKSRGCRGSDFKVEGLYDLRGVVGFRDGLV